MQNHLKNILTNKYLSLLNDITKENQRKLMFNNVITNVKSNDQILLENTTPEQNDLNNFIDQNIDEIKLDDIKINIEKKEVKLELDENILSMFNEENREYIKNE